MTCIYSNTIVLWITYIELKKCFKYRILHENVYKFYVNYFKYIRCIYLCIYSILMKYN